MILTVTVINSSQYYISKLALEQYLGLGEALAFVP